MKITKIYYIGWALVICSICAVSCKKSFLEVQPKGMLVAQSISDYEQMLNTATLSASSAPAFLEDDIASIDDLFSVVTPDRQQQFKYAADMLLPDELPEIPYLKTNYVFNKVINEIASATGGTEQQKNELKAEAKVGRAMVHLLFVNDFAKPYNIETAGSDLGVPIITTSDVTKTDFKRASVQEVYDFIIQDLKEALPYLTIPFSSSVKASRAAADGLLARVYLYMHNYTESLKYVEAAFEDLKTARTPVSLYDYNITLKGPDGPWYPISAFGPSMPTIYNSSEGIYTIQLTVFNISTTNAFVTTPQTAQLYNPMDYRRLILSSYQLFSTTQYPLEMQRYPEFMADVGISLPDLYLMRAEDKARTGDLQGAAQDLVTLRTHRMPDSVATLPTAALKNEKSLVTFILEERIREFAMRGMRWWDMRRLSVEPDYQPTIGLNHVVYSMTGDSITSYRLSPDRYVLKFGAKMLARNPELIENP